MVALHRYSYNLGKWEQGSNTLRRFWVCYGNRLFSFPVKTSPATMWISPKVQTSVSTFVSWQQVIGFWPCSINEEKKLHIKKPTEPILRF